jgi:hypothetical protein
MVGFLEPGHIRSPIKSGSVHEVPARLQVAAAFEELAGAI